ncbi:ANTAR domain-containing protein [Streptomyces sp. NPDC095817]|uniref:ANTAR domain-containing protein n=1 Tax=Streptomyces sp. NPDC095817 TaxID=3155082 RepID=UPI0033286382
MSSKADGSQPEPPPAGKAATQQVADLQEENAQLQHAVHAHAVVDQAIGVLLAAGRLTPDQGWDALRAISQHTNIKLRHIAEQIIEWARTGNLCTDIRVELERQLASYTPSPRRTG